MNFIVDFIGGHTKLDDDLKSAIKETRCIAKLILQGSTCLVGFCSNPFVIEWHHIGGKKNSSFLLPLCANGHVLASKIQRKLQKLT